MAKYIKAKYKFYGQPREIRISQKHLYWVYVRLKCGGWWMMDVRGVLPKPSHVTWESQRTKDPQGAINGLAKYLESTKIDARTLAVRVIP